MAKTGRPFAVKESDLYRLRKMYLTGTPTKDLVKEFGVSRSAILRFLRHHEVSIKGDDYAKIGVNDNYFEKIDTPDKAYWLGFLATDGNISGTRVCINLIDKEHLIKFAKCLGVINPSISVHTKRRRPNETCLLKEEYKIYRLQFRSKKMVEDLSKLGITPKKTWTVCPWNGPPDLLSHYWRGCLDGDGSVSYLKDDDKWFVSFCGNQSMVQGFADFIYKITGNKREISPVKSIFVVRLSKIASVSMLLRYMYTRGDIALDRKWANFEAIINRQYLRNRPEPKAA